MPNVSGKILVYKQWGMGYQRFNSNNMMKTKMHIKYIQGNSNNQMNQINKWHSSIKLNTITQSNKMKQVNESKRNNKFNTFHKICPLHEHWLLVIQKQSDVDSNSWPWIGWFLFYFNYYYQ